MERDDTRGYICIGGISQECTLDNLRTFGMRLDLRDCCNKSTQISCEDCATRRGKAINSDRGFGKPRVLFLKRWGTEHIPKSAAVFQECSVRRHRIKKPKFRTK